MQAEVGKGGSAPEQETETDVGIWRRAQGRAVEAVGWQVRVTPRWAELHTVIGNG